MNFYQICKRPYVISNIPQSKNTNEKFQKNNEEDKPIFSNMLKKELSK